MDEVLFRSSQKLENLQVQLSLAAAQSKDILQQYSQQSKSVILQAWNSSYSTNIRTNFKEAWRFLINLGVQLEERMFLYLDPQKLYYSLAAAFWKKWTKRDICFLTVGFICGSIAGTVFVLSIKKKDSIVRYMQAVQCTNYLGIESAVVVENAIAPDQCGENDVVINVKAASVNIVDAQICSGYGKALRKILQKVYNKSSSDLPVTLGRDCTGVITDIGSNVKRLDLGDEVWLTTPFWSDGTLSQSLIVPEYRVGRKPKNIGFEGACSLPYAGSLALNALKEIEITQGNAKDKKILVLEGCTPVGCVLIQILTHWKATVTTTCTKRAVPVAKALGAADIVIFPEPVIDGKIDFPPENFGVLWKELELREKFDGVIITKHALTINDFENFCNGKVVSTLPQIRISDSCGFFGEFFLGCYIRLNYILEKILGCPINDFDEAHMCREPLDELADLVESGCLQTVVDKVYHPQDIEIALNHIQSQESIGSTVITFR